VGAEERERSGLLKLKAEGAVNAVAAILPEGILLYYPSHIAIVEAR
jgi:hypothetical protein